MEQIPDAICEPPFQAEFVAFTEPADEAERRLLRACSHYPVSDRPLFTAAYRELRRVDLSGKRVVEVCCGGGELAVQLGTLFPQAEVVAVDRHATTAAAVQQAQDKGLARNVRYECADALRLGWCADASLDLIVGQAALHHLAHDPVQVAAEFSRALKPGGRLIFIFEPLGHNPFVAAVRAFNVTRHNMVDESNLFFRTLREIARNFSRCEVQVFNLFGYPLKIFRSESAVPLVRAANAMDRFVSRHWPDAVRYAANCNVIYTR